MGVTKTNYGGVIMYPKIIFPHHLMFLKTAIYKSSYKPCPIVSHGCGEHGHIRLNCPNKQVKRIMPPTKMSVNSRESKKAFISCNTNSIP